jgi:YD repeat-containing protein
MAYRGGMNVSINQLSAGSLPLLAMLLVGVFAPSARAVIEDPPVILWEAHGGDPCCGIPPENYIYLDADQACVGPGDPIPPVACHADPRNVRNFGGKQVHGGCVYDTTCTCAECGVLPNFPNGGNTIINPLGAFTSSRVQDCVPPEIPYLGKCWLDPPKTKGACPDCEMFKGNPVYLASGNKYQREEIYRAASGGLELVLSYNSNAGSAYFLRGPFGRRWTAAYFTRVRSTGQGIAAVEMPDGRELQFRQPQSGHLYTAHADVNERLERVVDGAGQIVAWRLTMTNGDQVAEHSHAGALRRDHAGTLLRVRDRALVEHTMTYSTGSTPAAIAPREGLLIAVTDGFGRQLTFTWDAANRVKGMTNPAGGVYSFQYDNAHNLARITFPDGKTRVYFYAEAAKINGGAACPPPGPDRSPDLPNVLTGIQDENGVRFATWTYDCMARVTSSEHAGGVERWTFGGYVGETRQYLDPLGASHTLGFQRVIGTARSKSVTRPAANGTGLVQDFADHDGSRNRRSYTDYNGNRTNYFYDARNLEISRTDGLTSSGAPTPQTRTVSTQWHPTFRSRTAIAEPLRITTNVYDDDGTQCGARGALCSKSLLATSDTNGSQGFSATAVGAARTWTYTYNPKGHVLTIDGPRTDVTDVTTYSYYPDGNVDTITNAAGHVTSFPVYNAHGQPLTVVDPNGLVTTMTYDPRLRLKTRTVGEETTSYDYDGVGQLTKVTLPDGSFLSYAYDAAHRLTGMQDNLGNRISYTLDSVGNRTREQVFGPSSQLAQTRSRVFNNLNRLFRELGATNQTFEYAYDNQGNVLSVKGPLNRVTSNQYDAFNRLKQVTDPASGVTQYGYNGLDALVQVKDPRNLVTTYTVDGLGNLNLQASPDTGTTVSTYDAAGNLLTQTDAKGQVTRYAYDALNRVTLITFHDGSKQTYTYDQGANSIGRLSSIAETDLANQPTSAIAYSYDQHGRVTTETRSVAGVQYVLAYAYDGAGRLSGLTYPSGRIVSYGFDALGRVSQVVSTKNSASQTVVQSVAYHPFGGVRSYTLGNGQVYERGIDLDGRIASYTLGTQSFAIGYDAASRITFISDVGSPANSNTYGYDELDRLTSAATPGTPYAYSYDPVGNRLSRTAGATTETYAYGATSNRLASITSASGGSRSFIFDANGSTIADAVNSYAYDVRGRMVQATSAIGTTSYQVNALGQRIRKSNSLGDTLFHYDTRGRLIAETEPSGKIKREVIYLGDIPVAIAQ